MSHGLECPAVETLNVSGDPGSVLLVCRGAHQVSHGVKRSPWVFQRDARVCRLDSEEHLPARTRGGLGISWTQRELLEVVRRQQSNGRLRVSSWHVTVTAPVRPAKLTRAGSQAVLTCSYPSKSPAGESSRSQCPTGP